MLSLKKNCLESKKLYITQGEASSICFKTYPIPHILLSSTDTTVFRAWIFKTSKMIPLHCFSEVSKILPNIFFSKKMILNPQEVIKIEHMHAWHFSFDSGQTRLTKEGVSSNPLEEHEFFLCSNYFILYAFILYIDLKWSQKFWVIYINNRFIYKQCVIKHWNII